MFSFFPKKDKPHEIEVKVNQILASILRDCENQFNRQEQTQILLMVIDRFRSIKTGEMHDALNKAKDLKELLGKLPCKTT